MLAIEFYGQGEVAHLADRVDEQLRLIDENLDHARELDRSEGPNPLWRPASRDWLSTSRSSSCFVLRPPLVRVWRSVAIASPNRWRIRSLRPARDGSGKNSGFNDGKIGSRSFAMRSPHHYRRLPMSTLISRPRLPGACSRASAISPTGSRRSPRRV